MTGDSWYSCVHNLKAATNHRLGFMFAVESNRRAPTEKGTWVQVQKLAIPEDGMMVWLRDFGNVKLFRIRLKDQLHHYIAHLPETDNYAAFNQTDFQTLHDQHWQIEQYHRMIKQVCNIENSQVRGKVPILNHLFEALCGYIHLQRIQRSGVTEIISNAYRRYMAHLMEASLSWLHLI